MTSLRFKQIGMIWLNEKLRGAVQIVGLYPPSLDRTVTIHVGPYKVRVIGIEDLIVDRVAHAKFCNSPGDMENATALYANFKKRLDRNYLRETAKNQNVEDTLAHAVSTERLHR